MTQLAISSDGGTAFTTEGAQGAVNAVRKFWDSVKIHMPDDVSLTVSPIVDVYNEVTGDLTDSVAATTAPTAVAGNAFGVFAHGVGFKVNWTTGQVRNGHRVKGHTYIVPSSGDSFTSQGVVSPSPQATVNLACGALIADLLTNGTPLVVWSRPRVLPTPRDGGITLVVNGTAGQKSAILRGRRD